MPSTHRHDCHPLWISGSIRATCRDHWWQPLTGTATQPQPATRS